jgi:tripartite-type tricarboxylate transporter receptor subunit TctC
LEWVNLQPGSTLRWLQDLYSATCGKSGCQFAINSSLYSKLPYETLRDFAPLTLVATAPRLLVVNPSVPAKSVKELIDLAQAKPGALNFGSGGPGTLAYVGGEMFKSATGVNMVHISYKGTILALNDLISGQVHVLFSDMPIALPHVKTWKLRALAVTSPQPTPLVPGTPTVAESGVPGFAFVNWWGIFAPRGVPRPIAEKITTEIVRAQALPVLKERYANLGVEAASSTPEQFTAYIKAEAARFAKVLRETGAKVD